MKILVSGSSGLVGGALLPLLESEGHTITKLVRSRDAHGVYWNYKKGEIDKDAMEGHDAVVHLAGETIDGRWTDEKKKKIRDSRVLGSKLISDAISGLHQKPSTVIAASAIGYYGDRGDEVLTEDSPPGSGFMSEVCRQWEDAYESVHEDRDIRVVHIRIGVVLSSRGGALDKMLTPFKLGLGGKIGSGKQYWSWIAIDDLISAIYHCIKDAGVTGPVNLTAPDSLTNEEFTDTLGEVLSRPTILPLPAFAARLILGEMADEALLSSTRVRPEKLLASGYEFEYPELKHALEHIID